MWRVLTLKVIITLHWNLMLIFFIDIVSYCQERPRRVYWSQVQRGSHWHVSSHQHLWGPGLHCFWLMCMERVNRKLQWTMGLYSNIPLYLQCDTEILFIICAVLSLFTTTSGWPTWEPTGKRWRRRPWWRHSQRSADMLFPWTSTRRVTCFTHQGATDLQWCRVSSYVPSFNFGLGVGGAGEEPCQPAVHHSHSSDARWWDDLAGARSAILWASTRWKQLI